MRQSATRTWLRGPLPPILFFIVLAGIWHGAVSLFDLPPFLLPSPVLVGQTAVSKLGALAGATAVTAGAAAAGFCLSLAMGCLIAFVFSQSVLIRRCCYPYAIFLQTVPIVAVAPLIIIWFGTGFRSVVLVSFIVGLFPIITNATAGLTSVDRELRELFRIHRASRLQTLLKLRFPSAVPYLIAGAKTSSGLSVIGAIVGEFFAGYGAETFGLGYLIVVTSGQLKTAYLFAAVFCATLLGLLIFSAVNCAGDKILQRWYRHQSEA